MVSKITIFEPHFDGAQFGPASIDAEAMEARWGGVSSADDSTDETDDNGKSPLVMVLQGGVVFVLMFVVLYTILRVALSRGEQSEE